jgi:hypothetical protein
VDKKMRAVESVESVVCGKFPLAFVLLGVIGFYQCTQPPTVPVPESKAKKLIYYGWGSPDTVYVRDHWREMEEMPFDGVGIVVPVDRLAWQRGKRDTHNQLAWQIMGKKAFRVEDFREAITDLQASKWRKFTDNFLPVILSAEQSTIGLNWFDEGRWQIVTNNFQVLARVAVESGIKGLILDPEHYNYPLFHYNPQKKQMDKPFDDYVAMARRRGREVMKAIALVMPRPVLLSLYGHTLPLNYLQGVKSLERTEYGLLPAFYDGLLESMPREGFLIDGYEFAYAFDEARQFRDAYNRIHDGGRSLSNVPDRYREKMRAGFGLWIDYQNNPRYFTPERFRRAVSAALAASDGYVWIYSERVGFFPPSGLIPSYIEAIATARDEIKR